MSDYTGQPPQGARQFGNYRLTKLLGSGGFAEVYEGEHVYLQTHAAIKILHAKLAKNEQAGFLNEAQTIARLQHEHIVRVLEFDVQDDTPFLVMEYAPGGTLREHFPRGKAVPLEQVLPVVQKIASALQYAHEQRLVHRDVKPDNMLLGAENEVLLSDFGIALLLQSTHMSRAHEVVGTVAYMAPEQLRGQPQPASDQYALAIAVYEWLCGERPFQGTSFASIASQHLLNAPPALRSKAPHLPSAVEEVVHKALAKDPEQRFPGVHNFALALSEAASGATITTPDISVTSESSPVTVPPIAAEQELTQTPLPEPVTPIKAAQSTTPQHTLTMTQSARPRRRTISTRMAILFGVLALLLAVGGTIAHFALSSSPQSQKGQDYQKLYLQATSGQPIIEDPLNEQNDLDWIGPCHFSGGSLHIQSGVCAAVGFASDNFAYQVEMTINAGKKVGNRMPEASLLFRYNSGTEGTYFLDVDINGSCGLGMQSSSPDGKLGVSYLIPLHACPAVHIGYHQTNLLTAIVRGSAIYLYINKQLVGTANDTTYGSGMVGLAAYPSSLDTEFKNLRIWNMT